MCKKLGATRGWVHFGVGHLGESNSQIDVGRLEVQEIHKKADVLINGKVHSVAGRHKSFYGITVKALYVTQ